MTCINKNHPEFKRIVKSLGQNPIVVAAEVGLWMEQHNSLEFPTVEDIQLQQDMRKPENKRVQVNIGKNVNETLNEKLTAWAKTHGIKIENLEDFLSKLESIDRTEKVLGAVDLLNKIIGIDFESQIDSTLAEEIAHFATSILKNDASVKKAMENIEETEFYKEIENLYKDTYAEKDTIKKEAVDKLLTKAILNEFKNTQETKGIMPYLKGIFEKFKKWVNSVLNSKNSVDTIQKELQPLAKKILSNEYLGEVQPASEPVLFQKEETVQEDIKSEIDIAKEFLEKNVVKLKSRLERLLKEQPERETLATDLQTQIKTIQNQIKNEEYRESIVEILNMATKELDAVKKAIEKQKETRKYNNNTIKNTDEFVESYIELFKNFRKQMAYYGFNPKLRAQLEELMQDTMKSLDSIRIDNEVLREKALIEKLDEINTDPYGNKIDKSFNPIKIIKNIGEDINIWRLNVGNWKQAKSPLIRSAFKLVQESNYRVKRKAVDTAEKLMQAQVLMEKDGVKPSDLVDSYKDEDNKIVFNQFLIRQKDWGPFLAARKRMRERIIEKLEMSSWEEVSEHRYNKKLTDEQLNYYEKEMATFNKDYPSTNIYDEQGRVIGKQPKKNNPKYTELMKKESVKNYYTLLLQSREEALNKLPKKYRTDFFKYMLPGIRAQFVEKLYRKDTPLGNNIKQVMHESLFRDPEDTEFGEIDELGNKMVPIYFTHKFEDTREMSTDLTRSFTIFSEMAENFREKNKIAGDIWNFLKLIEGKEYKKKSRGETKFKGAATNEYKAMRVLLEQHIFSVSKLDVTSKTIGENRFTKTLGINGKQFSWSKLVNHLTNYIRTNNLALSPFTSIAGAVKGSIDSIVEDQIGSYSTVESKNWSRKEYAKNLPEVLKESVYKKQTNKMHLLMRRANVIDLNTILKNTERSKIVSNLATTKNLYINYKVADYAIKGRVMLALYDNNRLVGDRFMDKAAFRELRRKEGIEEKDINKEWKTYQEKSYYNAFEEVDGVIKIKKEFAPYINDALETKITGSVEHVSNLVDGVMSSEDKGQLSRQILGEFLLMHRGWLINMLDSRFMSRNVNLMTGKEDMGYYQAVWQFLKKDIYEEYGLVGIFKALSSTTWKKLRTEDPAKARGIKKAFLDLIYLNVIGFIAALANTAADDADDDDYLLQFTAFQMNRILLEQASGMPIGKGGELISIIEKPVVGANTIKELIEITDAFNFWDTYERGMYADKSKALRWWIRKTPFKSLYEAQFPEEKNKFMKQVLGSPIYETMKNDDDEQLSFIQRMKNLLTLNPSMSAEQAYYISEEFE